MRPEIEDAITRAAEDAGEDPAFALAVAERESNGNPNARSSKSIYGIYQMRGDLRHQYGAGDSIDPYEQAQGWMRFMGATRKNLTARLGREPTAPELYLAHHFGEDRAASMLNGRIPGSMSTDDVFSPYEMSINPHFGKAGTVGNLTNGIAGDIEKRMARYGGDGIYHGDRPPIDFAQFGQPVDDVNAGENLGNSGKIPDFASFGRVPNLPTPELDPGERAVIERMDREREAGKGGGRFFDPNMRELRDPEASGLDDTIDKLSPLYNRGSERNAHEKSAGTLGAGRNTILTPGTGTNAAPQTHPPGVLPDVPARPGTDIDLSQFDLPSLWPSGGSYVGAGA